MPSDIALQIAARAWTTPETSNIEFDSVLATAFAEIIDELRQTDELVEKFVSAYDDCFACAEEDKNDLVFVNTQLFDAMLDARAALGAVSQENPCPTCGQIDHGQTGEYPCPDCGLPYLHDA